MRESGRIVRDSIGAIAITEDETIDKVLRVMDGFLRTLDDIRGLPETAERD